MARSRKGKLLVTHHVKAQDAPPRARAAWLYRRLREAFLDGRLKPGDRLPSTRLLADEHGVARATVEAAFDQLASEGLVERRHGSGSYVSHRLSLQMDDAPGPAPAGAPRQSRLALSPRGQRLAQLRGCATPQNPQPFNAEHADVTQFPWARWHAISHLALRGAKLPVLGTPDAAGHRPLRRLIAQHLRLFRGVTCDEDQVIVFSSVRQALNTLAVLLLSPGDLALTEDPGSPDMRVAIELAGATPVPAPVGEQGLRIEAARAACPTPRAIFVTPTHQYPAGGTLPLQQRLALLQWANAADAWVVEDDRDGEFQAGTAPIPAIQGMDHQDRVIHVGTFDRVMFPGLQVAYAVVPAPIAGAVLDVRLQLDAPPPSQSQHVLAAFMEAGELEAHIRRMRAHMATKRDALVRMLSAGDLPLVLGPAAAGSHLVVRCAEPSRDATPTVEQLARYAPSQSLALAALADFAVAPLADNALLLRFGGLRDEQIVEGVRQLERLYRYVECHVAG